MLLAPNRVIARRARRGFLAGALSLLALAAATPGAEAANIGTSRIRQISLRVAKAYGDARPRGMAFAAGPLGKALSVMSPRATGDGGDDPSRPVDLVVMHGKFTSHGPAPRGARAPRGRVLEVVIDAESGFVQATALMRNVPVALAQLGPVTRLG